MDYGSFVNEVQGRVERVMNRSHNVKLHRVIKNNGVELNGLVISEKGREEIAPTIYLEPFYKGYQEGFSLPSIVDTIMEAYQDILADGEFRVPNIEFEAAKQVLTYRLTGYKGNEQLLNDAPHIRFLDLAITFHYLYSHTENGIQSFRITNGLQEAWGVTVKEMFQIANENTQKKFPIVLHAIDDVLKSSLNWKDDPFPTHSPSSSEERVREWLSVAENRESLFVIIANAAGVNGATSVLYPNVISAIAEEWGKDVFLLPSSIHEVIVTPYSEEYGDAYLNKMVSEINRLEVPREDVLSNHVYLYKRESNKFVY